MMRNLTHTVRRHAATQIVTDSLLLVALMLVLFASQRGNLLDVAPVAGTHALSFAAGMFVVGTASGIYQRSGTLNAIQVSARALIALVFVLPLTYLALSFVPVALPDRRMVDTLALIGVAAIVVRRAYLTHAGNRARTRVLVFGAGPAAAIVADTLGQRDPDVDVVGFVPGNNEREVSVPTSMMLDASRPLGETARRLDVDEIVVALTERRAGSMPLRQLLDCKLNGIKVYDLATHFEKRLGQLRVDFVNAGWLVFGEGFNQGAWRTAIKRTFDVLFSLLLIVLSAPVMLLTALLIKLDTRGPVFYRQERVGCNGSTFMVTKFRSMRTDAERDGTPRWASAGDDRITRGGHVIRRLRIDELPQLFNVLGGQMSLVGPRPERPYFVEQLTQQIPYFAVRHSVKPGVTGWAQVRYQYGSTVEDAQQKLQYDLYYVKNHSLFLDLLVLFETVGVVLTGKGAR